MSNCCEKLFLPTDGQANPTDISQALAKGARNKGAKIIEETKASKVVIEDGKIIAVETDKEQFNAKKSFVVVVNGPDSSLKP